MMVGLLLPRRMIGSWHDTVLCLPVCSSVTLCIVALRFGVGGWKLYGRDQS